MDVPPGAQTSGTQIRYNFARWSNDGARSQSIVAGPQLRIIGANFETQYNVLVNVKGSGGTVGANPPSPDGFYTWGTVVTARATPAAGFKFLQWDNPSGLSTFHGLSSNPASFTVNSTGYAYTADFTNAPITSITTGIPGVTVSVDNTTVALPASFAWSGASTHTLAVPTPSQDNGSIGSPYRYSFQNWGDGGAASHTFTATSAGSAIASNWQLKYLVSTYAAAPLDFYTSTNGHISVSPASSECGNPELTDCYYPAGTKLT